MRTQHNLAAVALFSALLASAMPAQASPVYFSFADVNGVDLSFTIDTEAAPDSFFPGISTSFDGIEALSGGSSFTIFPIFYKPGCVGRVERVWLQSDWPSAVRRGH